MTYVWLDAVVEKLGESTVLALTGLLVGVAFGFLGQRSRFCLRSAVIEFARNLTGGKLTVWLFAFATAVLATQALALAGWFDASESRQIAARGSLSGAAVGGALFGIGMILARGCSSRLLILAAQGNLRALLSGLVFAVAAQAAWTGALAPVREAISAWWTVDGGARQYVEKIVAQVPDKRLNTPVQRITRDAQGVSIRSNGQTERFDKVVLACHSDQALSLLADPSHAEQQTLGAIRYQPNRAVLHTDTSVLPQSRRAWAAWNYQRAAHNGRDTAQVCLHYLINMLQPVPFAQPVVVSLNPVAEIDPAHVHASFDYAHPVFDVAAIRAQGQVDALQGQQNTYFCGAWTGYGFHEDGLKSGLAVAGRLKSELSVAT